MGLDVYVGTLTRCYGGGEDGAGEEARLAVLVWRDILSVDLQEQLEMPLDWDESAQAPNFSASLGWEGYAALLLWAAYAEHPELPRPQAATAEWEDDPAVRASSAAGFASRYGQLLYGSELWLPCEFGFTFRTTDACGEEAGIGSSPALLAELQALNAATWGAAAATLERWRASPPQGAALLEDWARYGLAVFMEMAERSVAHSLPMKLEF